MPGREKPTISVVIPTYNRKSLLERCLKSLISQTAQPSDYEIIIVDDGGQLNAGQMVAELAKLSPVVLQYTYQENQGPSAARNRGIELARGEIIAFIDDDCTASPDWLARIAEPLKNEGVGGVGGLNLSSAEGGVINSYCSYKKLHEMPKLEGEEVVYLLTANSAFRKSALLRAGLFRKEIAPPFRGVAPGAEDTELSIRLKQKGYRLVYRPDALTFHHHDKTAISLLKEMYNFGYNHALFVHPLEKREYSFASILRSIAFICLSYFKMPWHYINCRRQGLSRRFSIFFPLIEKSCMLANKVGIAAALIVRKFENGP